ncbi:MAG: DUF1611 domain-containing protein [Pseudomonadota bacterium]
MQTIEIHRKERIKPSFATRRVAFDDICRLDTAATDLAPGDLLLARVDKPGHHKSIERPDGRKALLLPGDEILIAAGARYAPDQFEAFAPTTVGPAHLVAAGGIAGIVAAAHSATRAPTEVTVLGAVCRATGQRIRLADYAVANAPVSDVPAVPMIAVCGTAMNAGKTTTVASLVRGFALAGRKVAAIKITGTGAGGDLWSFHDAGAHLVRDFTDAGFATTYREPMAQVLEGARRLMAEAVAGGAEVILLEIADGLHQQETAELMRCAELRQLVSGVVFAASDAMGAEAGAVWLRAAGHRVMALSGKMTASPLAIREAERATGLPVLTAAALCSPETARLLTLSGESIPLSVAA